MNFFNNNKKINLVHWILGKKYNIKNDYEYKKLISDYKSRILMTYRYNFIPIGNNKLSSDIGWGCMIRSGQMILAEILLRSLLGRSWRLIKDTSKKHYSIAHKDILEYFLDKPHPKCYFSIHKFSHLGLKFGKKEGDWYGPETISHVIKDLVNSNDSINMSVYVTSGSILSKKELLKFCNKTNFKLFLLIPLRLGLNKVNPIYHKTLFKFLEMKQSVGIIGGKPRYSLYFVGYNNDDLIYLDPHNVNNSVENNKLFPTMKDLESYHSLNLKMININNIDPSLALGFCIKNSVDLEIFFENVKNIFDNYNPIFELVYEKNKFKLPSNNKNNFDNDWEIL